VLEKAPRVKLLAKKHNLVYISTGKLLRKEIANGTEIGKIVEPFMEKGEIVPDEIPIKLIANQIKENANAKRIYIQGFSTNSNSGLYT